jgi:hypothetical protein
MRDSCCWMPTGEATRRPAAASRPQHHKRTDAQVPLLLSSLRGQPTAMLLRRRPVRPQGRLQDSPATGHRVNVVAPSTNKTWIRSFQDVPTSPRHPDDLLAFVAARHRSINKVVCMKTKSVSRLDSTALMRMAYFHLFQDARAKYPCRSGRWTVRLRDVSGQQRPLLPAMPPRATWPSTDLATSWARRRQD